MLIYTAAANFGDLWSLIFTIGMLAAAAFITNYFWDGGRSNAVIFAGGWVALIAVVLFISTVI